MKKTILTAAAIAATAMAAAPASATVYTYNQTNGDVLTINTQTNTGTLVGRRINTTFTSSDFSSFTGGAVPTGTFNLDSLDGYRIINGTRQPDNARHAQRLIFGDDGRTNLWSNWGPTGQYGDYITRIGGYTPPPPPPPSSSGGTGSSGGGSTGGGTDVPAPGMVLLFGAGAAALAYRRRRKNNKAD